MDDPSLPRWSFRGEDWTFHTRLAGWDSVRCVDRMQEGELFFFRLQRAGSYLASYSYSISQWKDGCRRESSGTLSVREMEGRPL